MTDTLPPAGWYKDPGSSSGERWWDGANWSDQTRPPQILTHPRPTIPAQATAPNTASRTNTAGPAGAAATARKHWFGNHWLQLGATAVVALAVGAAVAGSSNGHAHEIQTLKATQAHLNSRLQSVSARAARDESQLSDLHQQLTTARQQARNALSAARTQLQAQFSALAARLRQQQGALKQQASDLARQKRAFQSQVASYNNNTFPGSGLYLVGTDVPPGTYHTTGDDGGGDCYWARLASNDTGNILDNGNTTGPTTITILRTDKAFESNGCSDWHKVG